MSNKTIAWHSDDRLPDMPPPPTSVGIIGWMKQNLFSSVLNTILTVLSVLFLIWMLPGIIGWSLIDAVWDAKSAAECRERTGGHGGACWSVVVVRFEQLIYGFYSAEIRWRPNLVFLALAPFMAPVLFDLTKTTRIVFSIYIAVMAILFWMLTGGSILYILGVAGLIALMWLPQPKLLIFSMVYPVLAIWLIWGGSIWSVAIFFASVAGAYFLYRSLTNLLPSIIGEGPGNLFSIVIAGVALIAIWLFLMGPLVTFLDSFGFIGFESVDSAKIGGFLLTIIIGVTGIIASLPLGILLALGRQSSMLFIKAICVGFIEMIRGVPLITLLFVASTLLNYFLPPGTSFDLVMRVIIMVTLFASAYMAEVIRGGLAALPKGQYEAADALGLDYNKSMRLIIMPQALKISIPSIVNTFIGLFKDTTLVVVIGLLDPLGMVNLIQSDIKWGGTAEEIYIFIGIVFFIFCFGMSRYSLHLEEKLKTDHR